MDEEAMEKNLFSVTPTNIVPNDGFGQNSADSSNGGSSSPLSLRSDERVQSRYLSPHVASCHDFCKYGKKHDSDAQTKHLNFRKFLKAVRKREQENRTSPSVGERGRGTMSKPKVEPNLEPELSSKTETSKLKQTVPVMKVSDAYGEKKRIQTSLISGERSIKTGTKPIATAKKITEFLHKTGVPKMQVRTGEHDQVTSASPRDTRIKPATQLKSASKLGTKLSNKTDASRLRVEDKHMISQDPGEKTMSTVKNAKASAKVETEFSDEAELPELQIPPSTKEAAASGGTRTVHISIINEHSEVKSPTGLTPIDQNNEKFIKRESSPQSEPYDMAKAPATNVSREPNIMKEGTESPVRNAILSGRPKVIGIKAPHPLSEPSKFKKKVSLPPKRVDDVGRPTIALKTRTPLIRSISLLKSSQSSARRNHENKITRGLGTSKVGSRKVLKPSSAGSRKVLKPSSASLPSKSVAQRNHYNTRAKSLTALKADDRKLLKPTPAPFSKTAGDVSSNLQLRKLRSIKKTSTHQDSVSSTQPRKLWSNTLEQTPPVKNDKAPSLQWRKLRSIKRSVTPRENVSSLQPRKFRNVKQSSVSHQGVSTFQPRVSLRKVDRSLSSKERDNAEKTNTESKSQYIESDLNQKNEDDVESASSGVHCEEMEGNEEIEVSMEENGKRRFGRSTTAQQEDNNTSAPFKLKFRKGKVINFLTDSIGAKRLWFNIGKLANENNNGQTVLWRRSFKKKRDIQSSDVDAPSPEVESVVLKHQGVAERKDAQSLFNHVIEETASKLVETRKSKVKALVGAFETVISLQESKPTSSTVSYF